MAHEKAAIGNLLYVIPLRNLSRACSQGHAVHRSFWPSLSDTAAVAQPYRSLNQFYLARHVTATTSAATTAHTTW